VNGHHALRRLTDALQVALLLHLLSDFSLGEVASAFLVTNAAMEKRLSRGKKVLAGSKRREASSYRSPRMVTVFTKLSGARHEKLLRRLDPGSTRAAMAVSWAHRVWSDQRTQGRGLGAAPIGAEDLDEIRRQLRAREPVEYEAWARWLRPLRASWTCRYGPT
jgi:hypothetical protein